MGCEVARFCVEKRKQSIEVLADELLPGLPRFSVKRRRKQSTEMLTDELIPGLPNDVAIQCLIRVPVQAHAQLQRVSRKWRELVSSSHFYEERRREGTTMQFVCTVQALQNQKSHAAGTNCPSPSAAQPIFCVSVFNTRHRTWERLPHIPEHPHGVPLFCRLVAANRDLVVLGGWDPETWETLRSVYAYNFASRSWHRGADMPSTRSSFACVSLNDRIFVAGGHDNKKSGLATSEVYSLQKNEWRTLPRMSEERDECTGVALNGKLYVIGGYSTNSEGHFVKSADVYDPETNSWTTIEGMWATADTLSNSGIFAVLRGELYTLDHTTLLSYSTTNNSWSRVTTMPEGEMSPVHLSAVNDCLVLTGASRGSKDQTLKTFMYKPTQAAAAAVPQQDDVKEVNNIHSSRSSGSCGTMTKSSCPSEWEEISGQEGFLGVPQFACVVEV